jgi:hypothetical protein
MTGWGRTLACFRHIHKSKAGSAKFAFFGLLGFSLMNSRREPQTSKTTMSALPGYLPFTIHHFF